MASFWQGLLSVLTGGVSNAIPNLGNILNNAGEAASDVGQQNLLGNYMAKTTGSRLTDAEREANAFTAEREDIAWQRQMEASNTAYQRQVADMKAAGINPMMAVTGAGGASQPSASASGSVSPSSGTNLGTLIQSAMQSKLLGAQVKNIESSTELNKANAQAATQNAETNARNADVAERNAAVNERMASVNEMRYQLDAALNNSKIELNDAQQLYLAKKCTILEKQYLQMDEYLDIAWKNANSQEQQALAALKNAAASVQRASTADYLSNYMSSLMYAQELMTWAQGEGQTIVNKYLDSRQQEELNNLVKQGIKLDAEGRLIDKQGNLVTAQTVKTYFNCATDVANSVSNYLPFMGPTPAKIGYGN